MKKKIDGILVVEGKTDVAFLSQFIEAEFVTTNGSEISLKTIQYLKKCSQNRDIFVLTDPDSPGKRIRDILDHNISNLKHCFVNKENSIKHGKVGVAESTEQEVTQALEHYFQTDTKHPGNVTMSDLYTLGLACGVDAENNRNKISKKLFLGYGNAKTFLKRINNNGITIEELKNLL